MPFPTAGQHGHIDLDTGLSYHYLEWGQEHSHTLVLVHGFLDFCAGWEATVAEGLAESFHVVAPDMRGHGDSDRVGPGGYYHFMDYVADLHSFIQKLGKTKVTLVGHSMGGSIAGYYAGSFPDTLDKLVLMEGMGPPDNLSSGPARMQQWIRGWNRSLHRKSYSYATVEEAAQKLMGRDKFLSASLALELAKAGTTLHPDGSLCFKHDPLHLTMGPIGYSVDVAGEFWREITCPVLLISGADSEFNYSSEEKARRHGFLPSFEHEVIADAGHMMQRHQPAKLAQILRRFCTS